MLLSKWKYCKNVLLNFFRYLEELSKRYKKQSEDMMKMLNRTVARLNNATLEAEIKVKIILNSTELSLGF